MSTLTAPAKMPCSLQCDVPAGVELTPVPLPRHAWGDVIRCPNEGCGLAFLVRDLDVPPNIVLGDE